MLKKVQSHIMLKDRSNLFNSSFKPIFGWSSKDLEYVIVNGDQLYKEHNTMALLSCVDLPRIVDIENVKVTMTFLENVFGSFTENCQLELFEKITRTEQFLHGLSFFTQSVCIAIIPCKNGSQYYLVDLHARVIEG